MKRGVRAGTLALIVVLSFAPAACSTHGGEASRTPASTSTPTTLDDTKTNTSVSKSFSEVVPDEALASCLAAILDASGKAFPTAKAAKLTSLAFTQYATQYQPCGKDNLKHVTTLEGLQHFTAVTDLDLSEFSALKSITPVTSMSSLTQINLQDTAISDISALSRLESLSSISLPAHACNLKALAGLQPTAVNLQCPTADITPLDGKKTQIYVPETFSRDAAQASAQTGNTIGISQKDGSFEILQPGDDGTVTSRKI
ncbi:leucine-rich repeat domain-containing protein [Bifidobacterium moukalabense]|uniref:leucine-rich repeat domain-containing protein n=1 Tax=Bifidobacterium moukalabense TaxID=1333651 RepID=UPI0010F90C7D|nr:leucine-rich repeat domain-containing protein [Bifidobacterium moukalabense]